MIDDPNHKAPGSESTAEMAHVLFMDLVGYSKLSSADQVRLQQLLLALVQANSEYKKASSQEQLITLPTGDGMALVFFRDPVSPVRCAVELSKQLRGHPELQLRMGVHSGLVYRVADINANLNVAGGGINIAQRVMDCGNAGHILVSATVAGVLQEEGSWKDVLKDLGEVHVKHAARVRLFNLSSTDYGNPTLPSKLRLKIDQTGEKRKGRSGRRRLIWIAPMILVLVAVCALSFWLYSSGSAGRTSGPASETLHSLAILPFAVNDNSKHLEIVGDGVVEDIIGILSRYPNLRVTSRSTSFRYKGKELDPQKIGLELGASYVLSGRISQEAGRYIIKTEFLKTEDGSLAFPGNYARLESDVPQLAPDISQQLVAKLNSIYSLNNDAVKGKGLTKNAGAYQKFLQARFLLQKRNPSDCVQAITVLQGALALDPEFASAYASLAEANFLSAGEEGGLPYTEANRAALNAAERAVAIDPSLSEAHAILGAESLYGKFELKRAEAEYQKAIELNPSNAFAHFWHGSLLVMKGRSEEGLRHHRLAVEADPLSPAIIVGLGQGYFFTRDFDKAAKQFRKALELDSNYQDAHYWLGNTYIQLKEYLNALNELSPGRSNSASSNVSSDSGRALLEEFWRSRIADWSNKTPNVDYPTVVMAHLYAYLGEREKAYANLKLAFDSRATSSKDMSGLLYVKVDPRLDLLRGDPRFLQLIKDIGL